MQGFSEESSSFSLMIVSENECVGGPFVLMPTIMDGGKSIGMGRALRDTSIPIAHVERGVLILWSFTHEECRATGGQP